MKLFSTFSLKLIALILMLLDHIYYFFSIYTSVEIPVWFTYLGRISAPIFIFLVVEGFFKTRSRQRYMKRLFTFGLIMIVVDLLLGIYNNIFLSLALAVALMNAIEYVKTQEKGSRGYRSGIFSVVIIIIVSLFTEASYLGVALTLIFYFLRDKKKAISLAYIIFSLSGVVLMMATGTSFIDAVLYEYYQWMMVFSLPFILLYSGRKGINNKYVKWMFYIFYPAHLIALTVITKVIGA